MDSEANYSSGDDYVVEFLGYRFSFNASDFEQRVTAAAVKLGLLAGNELDDDETADLVELVERDAIEEPRSALGRYLVRHWDDVSLVEGESLVYWLKKLVFRGAWLDHRVKEGKLEVGWDDEPRSSPTTTRTADARCSSCCPRRAGTTPVPPVSVPRWYAVACPAYIAALLAVDTQVGLPAQLALGVLTWVVLLAAIWPLAPIVRAQVIGVVCFATVAEVTGSLVWGVYRYRLHNLPLFIPPAHGLVYLSGLALAAVVRPRGCSSPWRRPAASAGGSRASRCCRGSTSPARCACRCSARSSGGRASARRTPACSSSSRRSSCTARRSAPGAGRPSCPASASRTATRRAASRAATCGST